MILRVSITKLCQGLTVIISANCSPSSQLAASAPETTGGTQALPSAKQRSRFFFCSGFSNIALPVSLLPEQVHPKLYPPPYTISLADPPAVFLHRAPSLRVKLSSMQEGAYQQISSPFGPSDSGTGAQGHFQLPNPPVFIAIYARPFLVKESVRSHHQ